MPDAGEQAINKIAEVGIKAQLEQVDKLSVDVQTSPQALINGEVESVTIAGEGLEMQDALRTAKLRIETGSVAINPWKAAFGNIQLKRPVEAQAQITLTEQDIDRAFNSDYLQDKFQTLRIEVEGQSTAVKPHQIQFGLPGNGKVRLQADVELVDIGQQRQIAFTAVPVVSQNGHQIVLEQIAYENDVSVSDELTAALIESASELLDTRNFEMDGMTLQIHNLIVQTGKLDIEANASVQEFPGD